MVSKDTSHTSLAILRQWVHLLTKISHTSLAILRQWVHLLTKISELHFLWREELSLLSDMFYMLTGTDCLSYGNGYVLTAV